MFRFKRRHFLKRIHIIIKALPRKRAHKVDIDIRKTRPPCRRVILLKLLPGVNPSESPQKAVVRALQADAQPVDARLPAGGKLLPIKRSGIRFHGDLRIRTDREVLLQTGKKTAYLHRRKHGRRAAAHKDCGYSISRPDCPLVYSFSCPPDFFTEGPTVCLYGLLPCRKG